MDQGQTRELPKYKCHKEVGALKIADVQDPTPPGCETDGARLLVFTDERYASIRVDHNFVQKHDPQAGGYYVVYEDGYQSWSPAEAFEAGYLPVGWPDTVGAKKE